MKHTPTPWRRLGKYIVDANNDDVLYSEDNKDIIVKAVNCHYELIEALMISRDICIRNNEDYGFINEALAKAEWKNV